MPNCFTSFDQLGLGWYSVGGTEVHSATLIAVLQHKQAFFSLEIVMETWENHPRLYPANIIFILPLRVCDDVPREGGEGGGGILGCKEVLYQQKPSRLSACRL